MDRPFGSLADLPTWITDDLVTGVDELAAFERAFADDDTTIKTAAEFDSI